MVCACGDLVKTNYILPSNLGPCLGETGLRVASGVVLNGNGRMITGVISPSHADSYGVALSGAVGSTVTNLQITGFVRGVRLKNSTGNSITNNSIFKNGYTVGPTGVGYGIDLAEGASGNLLAWNSIRLNADEGVHFGTGSSSNQFVNNVVTDNKLENVYLLNSTNNLFARNELRGGTASFYIKYSDLNVFDSNNVGKLIHVIGDSDNNRFNFTAFNANQIKFSSFKKWN